MTSCIMEAPTRAALDAQSLKRLDAWWRASNYLAAGQIFLQDNPLLTRPLVPEDIKPRLLGHWGTTPGLNLIYTHLNRIIVQRDRPVLAITGPGHGGPAVMAQGWLEGTYQELHPEISNDLDGLRQLLRQFSFPGGVPSHAAPEVPGSIHEGGELGYALLHAFGAALDNPELLVACIIGDGEAETGPLAGSWHSNKFLDPAGDGAVLPILHLNGYKIANPTLLARMPEAELEQLLRGYGYRPLLVAGDQPETVHQAMAAALEDACDAIDGIQRRAGEEGDRSRPEWPMIVLRTPKGWTGPKDVDGKPCEGNFRSHQVPLKHVRDNDEHRKKLESWLRSYRPEELFGADGRPVDWLCAEMPRGERRLGATPYANGGKDPEVLRLPDIHHQALELPRPGAVVDQATARLGAWLREVMRANEDRRHFLVVSPDELSSNRLDALFEVTRRRWLEGVQEGDEHLAPNGRVLEVLSEHMCQGWLEGYTLTGRHGLFACYEAFIHIVDSMFNQHAKWLGTARQVPWRRSVPSFNYLLSSLVWRQDHNGFTHQDPGFLDVVMNKKPAVTRVYLPPDANSLLAVAQHCLQSRNCINVMVAGKQPQPQWLDIDQAIAHCRAGIGLWEWASNDDGEPDVVMACAGDQPTIETLAAVDLLRYHLPELKVRVVNVVDLMTLQPAEEHPHGLSDRDFDSLFTTKVPIIFAFHGYPWLIHRMSYRRAGHRNLHVRGYKEEGTTTTPFDMVVRNQLDRFNLVRDVIERVPGLGSRAARAKQAMRDALIRHHDWIRAHGEDMPEVTGWQWDRE
jgi:xylulose-5-phosphate/fructose-6-phosphate phosphoketolase